MVPINNDIGHYQSIDQVSTFLPIRYKLRHDALDQIHAKKIAQLQGVLVSVILD